MGRLSTTECTYLPTYPEDDLHHLMTLENAPVQLVHKTPCSWCRVALWYNHLHHQKELPPWTPWHCLHREAVGMGKDSQVMNR